ncbi:PEPxxWA-CTERM sorting domain-containing protein [Polymorphobacter sp. PAMC 29334]|uniref:PEPxxWA-CTERM sorting domain-containing protein n=1 Tax=Polymorphobacter sp. PAMC 29334 TaxID=2862331 RepID=UPI001D00A68E|nr:PEPxxWA-CTERM sorting domain-containing protein [Polymorphobacter sp. PAMC 29334]
MLGNPVRDSLLQGITNPQNGSFAEASFGSSDSQFAFSPTGSHHDGADFTSVEQWTVSNSFDQSQSGAEQKLQTYFSYGNDYDKVLGVPPFVVRTPAQFLTSLAGLQFSFSTEFTSDSYQSVLNEEGYFTILYDNTYQHGLSGSATLVSIAAAVPEPASWALMIAGFGLVGGAMRARATGVRYTTA